MLEVFWALKYINLILQNLSEYHIHSRDFLTCNLNECVVTAYIAKALREGRGKLGEAKMDSENHGERQALSAII